MYCTTSTAETSLPGLIVRNNAEKMEDNSLPWKPKENGTSLRKKFKIFPIQQTTSGSSAWKQDTGKEKTGNGSLDSRWPTHTGKITNRQGMDNVRLLLRSTPQEHTGNIMTWAAGLQKDSFANSKLTQPQVTALHWNDTVKVATLIFTGEMCNKLSITHLPTISKFQDRKENPTNTINVRNVENISGEEFYISVQGCKIE